MLQFVKIKKNSMDGSHAILLFTIVGFCALYLAYFDKIYAPIAWQRYDKDLGLIPTLYGGFPACKEVIFHDGWYSSNHWHWAGGIHDTNRPNNKNFQFMECIQRELGMEHVLPENNVILEFDNTWVSESFSEINQVFDIWFTANAINRIIHLWLKNEGSHPNYLFRKCKYLASRVRYYENTDASFNVEKNPGPEQNKEDRSLQQKDKRPKCEHCERTIRCNQENCSCTMCFGNFHLKCVGLKQLSVVNWTCTKCELCQLPFYSCTTAEIMDDVHLSESNYYTLTDDILTDDISQYATLALHGNAKHLKIMHLNTQSVVSTFHEFY